MKSKKETIIIGGEEFPIKCPKDCPGKKELPFQGGLCHRCPIFNCYDKNPEMVLLHPSEYRPDWAKAWKKWFENGMKDYPDLRF